KQPFITLGFIHMIQLYKNRIFSLIIALFQYVKSAVNTSRRVKHSQVTPFNKKVDMGFIDYEFTDIFKCLDIHERWRMNHCNKTSFSCEVIAPLNKRGIQVGVEFVRF